MSKRILFQNESFQWTKKDDIYSVTINVKGHFQEAFQRNKNQGFENTGFDWCTLILEFLDRMFPHIIKLIQFEPTDDDVTILGEDADILNMCATASYILYQNEILADELMKSIDYNF